MTILMYNNKPLNKSYLLFILKFNFLIFI